MGKPPGRPSKLTSVQEREICERLANGESNRSVARAYKVGETTIRRIFSAQVPRVRDVATRLAAAESDLAALPKTAQLTARSLADQLRTVSNNLAIAATNGSRVTALLSQRASALVDELPDRPTPEDLRDIAALSATGNEAAKPAIELVKASRSIQREEADEPATSLRDVGRMTDEELRAIVARGRLNG